MPISKWFVDDLHFYVKTQFWFPSTANSISSEWKKNRTISHHFN